MKEKKGNLLSQASGMFNVKSEIHAATRLSNVSWRKTTIATKCCFSIKDFVICINILAITYRNSY